jgi:dUTP pyrophosphatase
MSNELSIDIRREPGTEDLPLPSYQTEGAAGMDLYAAVDAPLALLPGERFSVPTGIYIAIPRGYEAQVRGRSGLARNHGVSLANGVGTIDADFRGHVQVLLINHGPESFEIRRGDRIAQLIVAPVMRVLWNEADGLEATTRGTGGFGHTGGGIGDGGRSPA